MSTLNVNRFDASKPGSTRWRRQADHASRPATLRSSTESATWTTTRVPAALNRRRPPTAPREFSCRPVVMRASEDLIAGRSAKTTLHNTARPQVNPRMRASSVKRIDRTSASTASAGTSALVIHCASSRPPAQAISPSRSPSVSSCLTIRRRGAPIADRTASSRARALPRASSRFATLAQATSRTMLTTTAMIRIGSRRPLRISVCPRAPDSTFNRGSAVAFKSGFTDATVCFRIVSPASWRRSAVAPPFRRPIIRTHQ